MHHFSVGDLDSMIQPESVAGVEVYNSATETPAQFMDPFSQCGSMLVWTRTTVPSKPKPEL